MGAGRCGNIVQYSLLNNNNNNNNNNMCMYVCICVYMYVCVYVHIHFRQLFLRCQINVQNACCWCIMTRLAIVVCGSAWIVRNGLLQNYYRYFIKCSAPFHYINLRLKDISSVHGLIALEDVGRLIVEVPRLHSGAPHLEGLLWTGDKPVAETSTWQHITLNKRQTSMPPVGFEPAIPAS